MSIYDFKKAVEKKEQRERQLCESIGLKYHKDIERDIAKDKQLSKKLKILEGFLVTICSIATCVYLVSLLLSISQHEISSNLLTVFSIITVVSAVAMAIVIIIRKIHSHRNFKKLLYLK